MGSVVWVGALIMHRISGHSLLRHWYGSYDMCMGEANLSPGGAIGIGWGEKYCGFTHMEGLNYLVYDVIMSSYV